MFVHVDADRCCAHPRLAEPHVAGSTGTSFVGAHVHIGWERGESDVELDKLAPIEELAVAPKPDHTNRMGTSSDALRRASVERV